MADTTSQDHVETDDEVRTVRTTGSDGSDAAIDERSASIAAHPVVIPPSPVVVERPEERTVVESMTPTTVTSPARVVLRLALVAIGAAGLLVGAFLEWVNGIDGIDLSNRVFVRADITTTTRFVESSGFVAMAIALVAVLGLALVSGWIIRLAGIAGIIAFVLSLISLARIQEPSLPQGIGVGLWMLLAGSIVIVLAGFVPTKRTVERSTTATTT
jgi:uncharacterized membrane protein YecN with MAPEG domain